MSQTNAAIKDILVAKGVTLCCPETIEIGDDIDPEKISGEKVTIHSGCKIYGSRTLILSGARIGYEGPVTVDNCFIGPGVRLNGGFFKESVFLKNSQMGYGAHVREGTIVEEMASVAHTVGLKQTILFPFVTLGSLINFCDCLMSGGTGKKDHSEVGSSYIHFNFTPNQDKATPSLLGDVPHGVMLNQPPIFLGGQGGLVGPSRIAFGTIIAAGAVYRKDELSPGKMLLPAQIKGISVAHTPGLYRSIKRIVNNNLIYITNLMALSQWYAQARSLFVSEEFPEELLKGCMETLNLNIKERIKRLGEFSEILPASADILQAILKSKDHPVLLQKREFHQKWPMIQSVLENHPSTRGNVSMRDTFLMGVAHAKTRIGDDYIATIQSLDKELQTMGSQWLQSIVDDIMAGVFQLMPAMG